MGKRRPLNRSPIQKVDHRGNYVQVPRAVLSSQALLSTSTRARAIFLLLLDQWNGFNNGRIGLSIENIGHALGNQNFRANSIALSELIDRGLVECMVGPNHRISQAREYRLTFISTGEKPHQKATNEWRDWSPDNGNIGPEATAVETWKPPEATAAPWKLSTEATAGQETETPRFQGRFRTEATAAHIHQGCAPVSIHVETSWLSGSELRTALNSLIDDGKASAAEIARAVGMLPGTMSKFRAGRNLPEPYHGPLQMELGRRGAFQMETPDAA